MAKEYTNEELLALTSVSDRTVEVEGIGPIVVGPMTNSQNFEAIMRARDAYGGTEAKPNGLVFMLWSCFFSLRKPAMTIEQLDRLPFPKLQAIYTAVSEANGFSAEVAARAQQSFRAGQPEAPAVSTVAGAGQDAASVAG